MYLSHSEGFFHFGQNTRYRLEKMSDKFRTLSGRFRLPHQGIWRKWKPLKLVQRSILSVWVVQGNLTDLQRMSWGGGRGGR